MIPVLRQRMVMKTSHFERSHFKFYFYFFRPILAAVILCNCYRRKKSKTSIKWKSAECSVKLKIAIVHRYTSYHDLIRNSQNNIQFITFTLFVSSRHILATVEEVRYLRNEEFLKKIIAWRALQPVSNDNLGNQLRCFDELGPKKTTMPS